VAEVFWNGGGAGIRTRVRKHYFWTSTCLSYLFLVRNQDCQ